MDFITVARTAIVLLFEHILFGVHVQFLAQTKKRGMADEG